MGKSEPLCCWFNWYIICSASQLFQMCCYTEILLWQDVYSSENHTASYKLLKFSCVDFYDIKSKSLNRPDLFQTFISIDLRILNSFRIAKHLNHSNLNVWRWCEWSVHVILVDKQDCMHTCTFSLTSTQAAHFSFQLVSLCFHDELLDICQFQARLQLKALRISGCWGFFLSPILLCCLWALMGRWSGAEWTNYCKGGQTYNKRAAVRW